MTARTRAIERKLVEWLMREGVFVNHSDDDPKLYVLETMPGKPKTPVATLRLTRLATAIELGEIS